MNMSGIMRNGWVIMLPHDDELPPLHRAARLGDLEQVSRCLDSGGDPDSLAVVQRNDWEIESMQREGRAESRLPALHAAVLGGDIAVIGKLLDSGADPNLRWHCVPLNCHLLTVGDFGTALVLAARADRTDIMTLLIERGVSPDADPEILPELAEGNQAAALRLLIERTSLPVDLGALFEVAASHNASDVVRLLQEHGKALAQINSSLSAIMPVSQTAVSPEQRSTALYTAADFGYADTVKILLQSGLPEEDLQEALRIACRSDNSTLNVIRLLLNHGADARGNNDVSPELLNAVNLQKENRVRLLLAYGAPVNGRYRYPYVDRRLFTDEFFAKHARPPAVYEQMTLLMLAAGQGAVAICRLLLDNGAEANARDAAGYPPLWYAVQERTGVPRLRGVDPQEPLPTIDLPGVIRLLISHGADPDAKAPGGQTPLEWIREARSEMEAVYTPEYIRAVEAALVTDNERATPLL